MYGHEFDDIIIPKRVIRPARTPADEYLTQPALDSIAFKMPNSIVGEVGEGPRGTTKNDGGIVYGTSPIQGRACSR